MKSLKFGLIAAVSVFVLSGCREISFLDQFVDQNNEVELVDNDGIAPVTASGAVKFSHTSCYTSYRTVCEHYVCGYDRSESCTTTSRCVSNGREKRCTPHRSCHTVSTPRYCTGSCHEEPYTSCSTSYNNSDVLLTFNGIDKHEADQIEEIALGVKTNLNFLDAIENPEKQRKEIQQAFQGLTKEHHTILVMKAKGLRFSANDDFMKTVTQFSRGATVRIDLNVERTGSDDDVYSSLGSRFDFPSLSTSD